MKIREISPVKPYFPEEDIRMIQKDVEAILRSSMLTLGEYTKRFELAFAKLCEAPWALAAKNEIFNLAGSEFITINDIVRSLRENFGNIKVKHEPLRPHNFKGLKISIEKAKNLLGWAPKTLFHDGLKKYVDYIKSL